MKSMGGERLPRVTMSGAGLAGDRVVQVYDRSGRLVTARKYPRLLRLHATLGSDGEPWVDGWPWNSHEVAERVETLRLVSGPAAAGPESDAGHAQRRT